MADHAGKTPVKKTVTREGKTHEQTFWVSPQHHEQGAHGAERQRQADHHSETAHRLSSYAREMDKQPRRGDEARHVRAHEQAHQAHREAADRHQAAGRHDQAEPHLAALREHGDRARALDKQYRAAAQASDAFRAGISPKRETPASHATRDAQAKQAARGVSARSKAGQELMRKLQAARPQQSHGPLSNTRAEKTQAARDATQRANRENTAAAHELARNAHEDAAKVHAGGQRAYHQSSAHFHHEEAKAVRGREGGIYQRHLIGWSKTPAKRGY